MNLTEHYLDQLREREKLPPFPPSLLKEDDMAVLEKKLGYPLPEQYREFLLTVRLPDLKLRICLSGGGLFFWQTLSPASGRYVDTEDGGPCLIDLNWYGLAGLCGSDYMDCFRRRAGEMSSWLKAGFLCTADFYMEDYFVFYDLVSGRVLYIHNEDINESSDVCACWNDPAGIRRFMENEASVLCRDFHDFLRLVCTGETYDDETGAFSAPASWNLYS